MFIGVDEYDLDWGRRWKPLDDAAKNGGRYLIGWLELDGQTMMAVAFWHSTLKRWVGDTTYTDHAALQPTHYMVLPAPPWAVAPAMTE